MVNGINIPSFAPRYERSTMIRSFKVITTLCIIVLVLSTGFVLFTEQVMERSTAPLIKTNLSQLPSSDLGFIYFDGKSDASVVLKAEQLLQGNYIQELYVAYNDEGEAMAKAAVQNLTPFGYRVHLMHQSGKLLTSLYNICQQQHDCTMMMIGKPAAVKHALFLALEIGQPASGYVLPNATDQSFGIQEMIGHVSAYFSTKSLSAQMDEELASL